MRARDFGAYKMRMRVCFTGGRGGRCPAARNVVGVAFPELRSSARARTQQNSRFMHMRIGSPKVTHVYIIIEDVMKRLYISELVHTDPMIRSTVKHTVPGDGR